MHGEVGTSGLYSLSRGHALPRSSLANLQPTLLAPHRPPAQQYAIYDAVGISRHATGGATYAVADSLK